MCICETFRSCPVRYGTLHGPLLLTLPHPRFGASRPCHHHPNHPAQPRYPCQHSTHLPCSTPSTLLPSPAPHHTYILSLHKFLPLYQRNSNQTRHAPPAVTCSQDPLPPVGVNAQCRLVPLLVKWHFWHQVGGLKDHLAQLPGQGTHEKVKVAESVGFLTLTAVCSPVCTHHSNQNLYRDKK